MNPDFFLVSEEDAPLKSRIDLVPPEALNDVGKVLAFGRAKHGENTWLEVSSEDHMAAAMRHVNAHQRGIYLDAESQLPHLAHAVCRLMFIVEKQHKRIQ